MRLQCALLVTLALAACGGSDGGPAVVTPSATEAPAPAPAATVAPVAGAPTDPATGTDAQAVRSITVGGMGAEYAPPTRSTVNLAVQVRRSSVLEASVAATAAGRSVIDALTDAGVQSSGIQTADFSISPVYAPNAYPMITGYEVRIGYQVSVPDVGLVGSALAAAISAGGDDVRASSVRFEVDPSGLMDAARAAAWTDVRARAESTASLAGEPLGPVLDVHEKVLITSPQGMVQGGEGDSASFDIPVSPGVAGVTVLLTVTYAIGGDASGV